MKITATLIAVARRFLFVREVGGANRGKWVQLFQRFTGNAPGDSWCASFVSYVLDIVYEGKSPLKRTASCAELLADAVRKGLLITRDPKPGALFFYIDEHEHAHHAGIVTAADNAVEVDGIAGNTNGSGTSSNGDGVYEHGINTLRTVYVILPDAA